MKQIDFKSWAEDIGEQFKTANAHSNDPGQWPPAPRWAAYLALVMVVFALGWYLLLSDTQDELEAERNKEPQLKSDFQTKWAQAVNLPELRRQKSQAEEYVNQLEKQLPGRADMDALLSDINQAGLGRGLQFELFRPATEVRKDYYAEQPIALKVTGRFHDIGAFTSDISNLSRIVTLHQLNLSLPPGKDSPPGVLTMEALARTYRYMDQTEIAEQKALAAKEKAGARK